MVNNLFVAPDLEKIIDKDSSSLLDVGCGGKVYQYKSKHNFWEVFKHIPNKWGIDINLENIIYMREKYIDGIFICMDVMLLDNLRMDNFDIVHCQNVIEHLNKKEALRLIKIMETLANKQVILGTPKGFREIEPKNLGYVNPAEKHICEFTEDELKLLGYNVIVLEDYLLAHKEMKK